MSQVEFEEDVKYRRGSGANPGSGNFNMGGMSGLNMGSQPQQSRSKMTQFLINHGLASSQSVAQIILLGIVVFNFVAAYLIYKYL